MGQAWERVWVMAPFVLALVVGVSVFGGAEKLGDPGDPVQALLADPLPVPTATAAPTSTPEPTPTPVAPPEDGLRADQRELSLVQNIGSFDIRPKSVVHNGDGIFIAQNIMYRHTITVYDRDFALLATIPDTVDLAAFGHDGYVGNYQGAPVEAAFESTGRYAYVSNYRMYGPGFTNPGHDECFSTEWDNSYLYRLDTETLEIDQVIEVGAVPKLVAVTPNDEFVLVTNWCSQDMSVVSVEDGVEIARVPVGLWPRGIDITSDSRTAFVTEMGSDYVHVVDLETFTIERSIAVGEAPRHVVLSPDETLLYVSVNIEGVIAKVDVATGEVLGKVVTGALPRSMTISADGTALYVVNNGDATIAKVRTSNMEILQILPTGEEPIGIVYDAGTRNVWVSVYTGQLMVFGDRATTDEE